MAATILIIDDSRAVRSMLTQALRERGLFDVFLEAGNGAEGLKIVESTPVDLVLCDVDMPAMDGFTFLRLFRSQAKNQRVPVLMLSGTDTPKKKVEGFAHGANDYIIKSCDPDELHARVRNYLQLKMLSDELERKNRELEQIAITDSLTGLYNRRHFLSRAEEEIKRSRRHQHTFGILMMDIDHFKRINDTYGHPQGDAALVAVAETLRTTLRQTDFIARFGGEEFIAFVPETARDNVPYVGERLRSAVEATRIPGMPGPITISIGVSVYPSTGPQPVDSIEQLVALADQALYRAKAGGRNRVESAP